MDRTFGLIARFNSFIFFLQVNLCSPFWLLLLGTLLSVTQTDLTNVFMSVLEWVLMGNTVFSDSTIIISILLLLGSRGCACSDIFSFYRLNSGFLNVLEVQRHNVKLGLGTG